MTNPLKTTEPEAGMNVMDAIFRRRAVRDYTSEKIDHAAISALLDATVRAPTALHEEPWAFVVIQDKKTLDRLSDSAKKLLAGEKDSIQFPGGSHALDLFTSPDFNTFYNAGTLIVIYAKPMGPFVVADCWLAAENLMLAACAKGLGTCVIGLCVSALNTPEWKKELGVDAEMTAIAPIILGVPAGELAPTPRKPPEILAWK